MLLKINSQQIRDNAIVTSLIADSNVTNAKLASGIDAAKIADGSVSNAEFQYLAGVTSPIQTQLDGITTAQGDYVAKTGDTMTGHLEVDVASGNGGITVKGNTDSAYGGQINVISDAGPRITVKTASDLNNQSYLSPGYLYLQPGFGQPKIDLNAGGTSHIQSNVYVTQGYFEQDLSADAHYFSIQNVSSSGNNGGITITRTGANTAVQLGGNVSIVAASDAGNLTVAGLTTFNGGATVPTGKVITITDLPTAGTDGANKTYVDNGDATTLTSAEGYTDTAIANEVTRADAAYVNVTGDTMTGSLLMGAGAKITFDSSYTPGQAYDSATKGYVDAAVAGLHVHDAVQAATTGTDLGGTYAAGSADDFGGTGLGATLTNAGTQAALVVDGVTLAVNDRVLVKDQTDAKQNGIYVVTDAGSVSSNWVLTRAADFDNKDARDIAGGDFLFVEGGTVNASQGFVETAIDPVIGTDNITFTQFSGTGDITPGYGLEKVGNELNVLVDGTSVDINNSNQVEVKDGGITNVKVASGIDAVKIGSGSVDNTEFGYLDGVTSSIQTQLDTNATAISTETTRAEAAESDLASAVGSAGPASSITYTTNNYVSNGDDLIKAIGELDAALAASSGGSGSAITDLQAAVGSSTGTAGLDYSSNRVVVDGTSLETAVGALDAAFVLKAGDSMTGQLSIDTSASSGTDALHLKAAGALALRGYQGGILWDNNGTGDLQWDIHSNAFQVTTNSGNALRIDGGNDTVYIGSTQGLQVTGSAITASEALTATAAVNLNGTAGVTVASGNTISWADAPTTGNHLTNKTYVDAGDAATLASANTYTDAETTRAEAAEAQIVSDLASTATGKGASLVGIEDAGSFFTATTVEGALAEIANGTSLDGRYVNVSGDTMTGHLQLNAGLGMNLNGNTVQINGGGSGEVFQITGSDNLFTIDTQAETVVISAAGKTTTVRGSLTVDQDAVITGNLTVNGTTTHVNSTTVDIGDSNIELNTDITTNAANSNGGITIKRLDTDNTTRIDAVMQWNETSGWWEAGANTDISRLVRYEELGATSASEGASLVGIQDAGNYFTSTNVEGALQELGANVAGLSFAASSISYNNSTSGMTATNVQDAIDELDGRLDTAESNISTNSSDISALQAAVGSSTGLAGLSFSSNNYVTNGTSLETAVGALDTAVKAVRDDLASTSTGLGASLVGLEDAGSFFSSTTVEGALAELGTNGANGPLHQGYDELLVDSTIETANASADYDITLSHATTVAGALVKVFVNGALQVFDNGTNTSMPTAYTKPDNSTIAIKQGSLLAGDVIQIHYNY